MTDAAQSDRNRAACPLLTFVVNSVGPSAASASIGTAGALGCSCWSSQQKYFDPARLVGANSQAHETWYFTLSVIIGATCTCTLASRCKGRPRRRPLTGWTETNWARGERRRGGDARHGSPVQARQPVRRRGGIAPAGIFAGPMLAMMLVVLVRTLTMGDAAVAWLNLKHASCPDPPSIQPANLPASSTLKVNSIFCRDSFFWRLT